MARSRSAAVQIPPEPDPSLIDALVQDLNCDKVIACQKARRQLVALGKMAVNPLIDALKSRKPWVRWEAAKALGEIGDPVAAEALAMALRDNRSDVRWLAAEALITMGKDGVEALLQELTRNSDSLWMLQGAHHVFHDIKEQQFKQALKPVLDALDDVEPTIQVPIAAKKVLDGLNVRRTQAH